MRPVLLSIAYALTLAIASACSKGKPMPRPNVTIPSAMQGHPLAREAPPGHAFVYDSSVVFHEKIGPSDPEFRVVVLEATLEGTYVNETYRATRLGHATMQPDAQGWDILPIDGKLTVTETSVRVELAGDEAKWNGEYLTAAEAQQRQWANAPKNEAKDGGTAPPSPCQRYSDCTCALDAAATLKGGDNPFRKACDESKGLLLRAPDDPKVCTYGLSVHRELAPKLGYTVPAACAE
ncbi:hypothetical protein [Polyangium jinanense]|uniref:Lipoprotein n=1 Tax=Polyangium jinanense TaxID=2829994 RepID=A0A9X3X7R9_9BACT|nr:hypothetical protein [Polyangium jinanense]MDC3956174.1 hypothetical protein [Polyangium jinanense]MDC3982991.1 hypothetical protein [Polyangium jinanense]